MACSPPGSSVRGDSPGKNTGVGCRSLLQGIFPIQGLPALQVDCLLSELPRKPHLHQGYYFITGIALTGYLGERALQARKKVSDSCSVVSESLRPHGLYPARLLCPWGFSGQEHWSGLRFFPQGIFRTRASNPGLLRRRLLQRILHQQRHLLG